MRTIAWLQMLAFDWDTSERHADIGVEGGQYFGPSRMFEVAGPARQVQPTELARDPAVGKRLWELSVGLTQVDPVL